MGVGWGGCRGGAGYRETGIRERIYQHCKEGAWKAFIQFPLGLPRNLLLSMNQAIWLRLADPVQQQGVAIILVTCKQLLMHMVWGPRMATLKGCTTFYTLK